MLIEKVVLPNHFKHKGVKVIAKRYKQTRRHTSNQNTTILVKKKTKSSSSQTRWVSKEATTQKALGLIVGDS